MKKFNQKALVEIQHSQNKFIYKDLQLGGNVDLLGSQESQEVQSARDLNYEHRNVMLRRLLDQTDYVKGQTEVVPFAEKFERQEKGEKTAFKVGEKITAPFIIQTVRTPEGRIDRTKISLLVDGIDVRHSDQFVISVTPEKQKTLQEMMGMVFQGVVEISGEGRSHISNMFEYPAKMLEFQSNMPTNPQNVENFELGQPILVEGKIAGSYTKEIYESEGKKEPQTTVLQIETAGGEVVEVYVDSDMVFEDSPGLENANGKKPKIGDTVRIKASVREDFVGKNSTYSEVAYPFEEGRERPSKVMYSPWCRSAYLLKPNQERLNEYQGLHEKVARRMSNLSETLSSQNYQEARQAFSFLVKQELTSEEASQLNGLHQSFPERERPIMVHDRNRADTLNKRFNRDIDGMTNKQFHQFAIDSFSGTFGQRGEGDATYVFDLFRDLGVPAERQEELLSVAIDGRLAHFKAQKRRGEKYDHEKDWDDRYSLEQAIKYLNNPETPTATQKIFDVMDVVFSEKDLTREESFMMYNIGDTLVWATEAALEKNNKPVLEVLRKNLGKLRAVERKLLALQVSSPETSSVAVVGIGLEGLKITPEGIQNTTPPEQRISHRYSTQIRSLRSVINMLDPQFENLKKGDFHEKASQRMQELAETSPFFKKAVEAMEQKGYKLAIYDQNDTSIPPGIREFMVGSAGAVTIKERRVVYIDLDNIERHAHYRGISPEEHFVGMLANESVHMIIDSSFRRFDKAGTQKALNEIRQSPQSTETERMVHSLLTEEILSQVADDIAGRQLNDPAYRISTDDITSPNTEYGRKFANIKTELAVVVLNRTFDFDPQMFTPSDTWVLSRRFENYLNSGEIEQEVIKGLKLLDLI